MIDIPLNAIQNATYGKDIYFFDLKHDYNKNITILRECLQDRQKTVKPLLGDFVLFPSGEIERICSNLDSEVQTIDKGSFYLSPNGGGSYSGCLNPPIKTSSLALTENMRPGSFWFFSGGTWRAHKGVYFEVPVRIFTTTETYNGYDRSHW